MMPIREFESWFAQQLVPWRRVLWMTAILALFVPTALVLGLQEAVGVALPFAFEIVVLGLTFAIWASGLLMLTSWLHPARVRGSLERLLDRVFVLTHFTDPPGYSTDPRGRLNQYRREQGRIKTP